MSAEIAALVNDLNAAADRAVSAARSLREATAEFKTAAAECRELLTELLERVPLSSPDATRPN
jgi:outer membrane protein TolC